MRLAPHGVEVAAEVVKPIANAEAIAPLRVTLEKRFLRIRLVKQGISSVVDLKTGVSKGASECHCLPLRCSTAGCAPSESES